MNRTLSTLVGTSALAVGISLAGSSFSPAHASFVRTISGNDCSGVYGTSPNCVVPADPANGIPNATPQIIKFEFNDAGVVTGTEINPLFASITGNEFSFDFGTDGNTGTGTWTYNPGANDPVITAFVAKGGPNFNLFSNLGDPNSDTFFTPTNNGGNTPGLSHLTFYDTATPIPEPITLLGSGIALGFGTYMKRKMDKAKMKG